MLQALKNWIVISFNSLLNKFWIGEYKSFVEYALDDRISNSGSIFWNTILLIASDNILSSEIYGNHVIRSILDDVLSSLFWEWNKNPFNSSFTEIVIIKFVNLIRLIYNSLDFFSISIIFSSS